jgi:hypothetical protein
VHDFIVDFDISVTAGFDKSGSPDLAHQPRLDRFSRSPANLLDSLHAGSQQRISDSLPPRPVG